MRQLILQYLGGLISDLSATLPITKREIREIYIEDVTPSNIVSFMEDNNIPKDAWFSTNYEEGLLSSPCPILCWYVNVSLSKKERLDLLKRRFSANEFKRVFEALKSNGYKRVDNTYYQKLREFDDTCPYDMYVSKDYDRLVKYYSLYFVLEGQK